MANNNGIVRARSNTSLTPEDPSFKGPSYWSAPAHEQRGGSWHEVVRVIRRHWKISAAFAVALEVLLLLVVLFMHNTYQAGARLQISPPGGNLADLQGPGPAASPEDDGYLDTQVEILRGAHLASDVISDLHLAQNPVFLDRSWIQKSVGWLEAEVLGKKKQGGQNVQHLIKIFEGRLDVQQVTNSELVDIQYESRDPQLAQNIVSDLVNKYLNDVHRAGYDETLSAAAAISPQIKALQKSVETSDQALLDFQKTHPGVQLAGDAGIVAPIAGSQQAIGSADTDNPIATRVADLNQQLTTAMGNRLQLQTYMQQIQEGKIESLPQMTTSPVIQQLTEALANTRAQLAQEQAIYGNNNPEVLKLQDQASQLDRSLQQERNRIASQIEASYRSSVDQENLIHNTLAGLKTSLDQSNADVVQYDLLKQQAAANAGLFVGLNSRIKELAVTASLDSNNVRVLDNPRLPMEPNGPHRMLILAGGLFTGLLGGVALAFAAEGMNDTISTTDDLRSVSDLPALALVPESRLLRVTGSSRFIPASVTGSMRAEMLAASPVVALLHENSRSPEAEAIRSLDTAIRVSSLTREKPIHTILITSPFPGEGKTTVAANLAMALSRHSRTCLIDADLRHPKITPTFGVTARMRLLDALSNPKILDETPDVASDTPNLTVLGADQGAPRAVEALTSKEMESLMTELRKRFEYVVLDSPPIIPFAEARWLSALADGIVLVARCSSTTRKAMVRSMEILEEARGSVLGVVLNGANLSSEYYAYGPARSHYQRTSA
ncbi:MAG TPA: polysaccharide biosynthesis tyrosine autokinase [Candidatus Acidoferrum sp.]|nr:polysaccharide biosynthesis tyrosine autokinase [Candidatus Acidoferrum sp.]